jgi:hypothetical protein
MKRGTGARETQTVFLVLPLPGGGRFAALRFGGFSPGDRASGDESLKAHSEPAFAD